jgi:hypothetical protein
MSNAVRDCVGKEVRQFLPVPEQPRRGHAFKTIDHITGPGEPPVVASKNAPESTQEEGRCGGTYEDTSEPNV